MIFSSNNIYQTVLTQNLIPLRLRAWDSGFLLIPCSMHSSTLGLLAGRKKNKSSSFLAPVVNNFLSFLLQLFDSFFCRIDLVAVCFDLFRFPH